MRLHFIFEPVHQNLVLNAYTSSDGSDESVRLSSLSSLTGSLILYTSKEWTQMKAHARSPAQLLVDTYANTFEEGIYAICGTL